jgi:hypothetical protein
MKYIQVAVLKEGDSFGELALVIAYLEKFLIDLD